MILALFVMIILFTLGVAYLTASSSSLRSAKRDVIRAQALACAEAGVDKAIDLLMSNPTGTFPSEHPSASPDIHTNDTWYTVTLNPGESFRICVRNGTGVFAGKTVITSEGIITEGGAIVSRHTAKVVVTTHRENISVWNNAIFGGVGQVGRSINGNVAIRGSMHLLGDGESYTDLDGDGHWSAAEPYTDTNHNGKWDPGEPYTDSDGDRHYDVEEPYVDANGNGQYDPPLTVTDMASEVSGTANVGNNYSGMPDRLKSVLPALNKVSYGGEQVDSLDAKLRVKHGRVNISGSATVGDPNVTGNTIKETLDATYVSDGYGGNKGAASVNSDNGSTHGYDLGEGAVDFPLIDTGSYTKNGVTYTNYLDYLHQNGTVYNGDLAITNGTALTITGPHGSLTVDASGHMTISGIVYVTGNISFGTAITYSDQGSLVTPHSVYVHSDVMPAHTFPTTDALGLIAGDKIELATGAGDAQLKMALAMYAQHEVICNKQSDIAGTIVSSYYSMSNVPRLYQVPELANHLPPGMPAADPIWIVGVNTESWQDVLNP